jgi:hypothetical protein
MNRFATLTKLAAGLFGGALLSGVTLADEAKHFRHGSHYVPPGHVRPVVVPAPLYRPVAPAPVIVHRPYGGHRTVQHHNGFHHDNNHRGYWRDGRWIAPVVIGAAVLGTIAAANHAYAAPAPTVTYVNPAPVYSTPPVTYVQPHDNFRAADRDGNGFIDKWEASYDRNWERWFYDIDVNRDGFLSREELQAWSAGRRSYN